MPQKSVSWQKLTVILLLLAAAAAWLFTYHFSDGGGREENFSTESKWFENGWYEFEDEYYFNHYVRKLEFIAEGQIDSGRLEIRLCKTDGTLLREWSFQGGQTVSVKENVRGLKEECIVLVYRYTEDIKGDVEFFMNGYCFGYDLFHRLIP